MEVGTVKSIGKINIHNITYAAKVIITATTSPLSGRDLPLKESLKIILDNPESEIQHILVYKRTDKDVPMKLGRDKWLEEVTIIYNIVHTVTLIHNYNNYHRRQWKSSRQCVNRSPWTVKTISL